MTGRGLVSIGARCEDVARAGVTLTVRFDLDEVPEMRRKTDSQACARRRAIPAQTRMPRAQLAAEKTATDSNEIPQGPTELVGALLQ
jgi:hypothetical protein